MQVKNWLLVALPTLLTIAVADGAAAQKYAAAGQRYAATGTPGRRLGSGPKAPARGSGAHRPRQNHLWHQLY